MSSSAQQNQEQIQRLTVSRDNAQSRLRVVQTEINQLIRRRDLIERAIREIGRIISNAESAISQLEKLDCENTTQWNGNKQRQAVAAYNQSLNATRPFMRDVNRIETSLVRALDRTIRELEAAQRDQAALNTHISDLNNQIASLRRG